jgi:hypothetical protein
MLPHHLLLSHGGDEDAFEVGGSQISAPRGDQNLQLSTIPKTISRLLVAFTFLKITVLIHWQGIHVSYFPNARSHIKILDARRVR